MLWDVFCRVIDNFGDIGVCWRLAVDLGQRGHQVRLWVDDASALHWMAPQLNWGTPRQSAAEAPDAQPAASAGEPTILCGQGQSGVQVHHWADAERSLSNWPALQAGDVVIEAFGCNPPDAFIERMQSRAAQGQPAQWLNLEYLSAEDYVERSHSLASPVWAGVGSGLSKRFFYPGFTPRTGGLLREPDLLAQRAAQTGSPARRQALLADMGVPWQPGHRVVLVFCYDSAPLGALLDQLAAMPGHSHVLLAPGAAARLGQAWCAQSEAKATTAAHANPQTGTESDVESDIESSAQAISPLPGAKPKRPPALTLHALPHLPQPVFDQLMWCCDLNFVRGEDTAVRALWAGKPHVWQIYEQDDGVHAGKLDAFMNHWMAHWPPDLRRDVAAWWRAWNNLGAMPAALPRWDQADSPWRAASLASREELRAHADLVTQLIKFVTSSG